MNLRGSVAKLQKFGARFYLRVAERFSENALVRDTWMSMARDLEQQEASLRALPAPFWTRFRTEERALLEAIRESLAKKDGTDLGSSSLQSCFARTLDFEEPLTLRIYTPLIRGLRAEWSNRSVDFYVVIKAHLARLTRTIGPFSGDPTLIRRSVNLLEQFEREVQAPPVVLKTVVRSSARKITASRRQGTKGIRPLQKTVKKPVRSGGLPKRAKGMRKPLVKNLEMPRRRVRR